MTIKSRVVTIVGPRGTVERNFRHAPVEMHKVKRPGKDGEWIRVRKWFGRSADSARAGTLKGVLGGMFVGVTQVSLHPFSSTGSARSWWMSCNFANV